MGKRGEKKHMKRIASPKAVPIPDKKEFVWVTKPSPGPHPKKHAIPLGVLVRDTLKLGRTAKEARRILASRLVKVDGKVRVDEKFPVGLMDVLSIPKSGKHYRISVDRKGRLVPVEVKEADASSKIVKVIKKHVVRGGKINLTFHDGKNMLGDNHVMVGDSVVVSLPEAKMKTHLKRDIGSRCLVIEGKHAGTVVKLKEIMQRKGGKPSEAVVQEEKEEFVTVAKYLFVVDEAFKVDK